MFYIANWKCNLTTQLIKDFLTEFSNYKFDKQSSIIIAPPAPYLSILNSHHPRNFQIAAQDVTHLEVASATGEISANMLKDLGAQHVIIGHSERRRYFGESGKILSAKFQNAIAASINPIFCVGELSNLATSNSKDSFKDELKLQLDEVSNLLGNGNFMVAYEPTWAIGTGISADRERIEEVIAFLHSHLSNHTTVLYGGSVNPDNVNSLKQISGIGGFLIGGASLNATNFAKIINSCA